METPPLLDVPKHWRLQASHSFFKGGYCQDSFSTPLCEEIFFWDLGTPPQVLSPWAAAPQI